MFYSKMSPPSSGLLWQKTKTVFTVALVHWAGLQHRKQQSGEVRCDLVTLPAGPLERKETDWVTVLVYVVSVITPVVVYCGGWAGEGLACPCLWRAAIILSTRHSPGSWRDQWGQQQSVSNCAIKWVPAVHLIRVLTELQEAGGREEGTVSCGSFQNCLFQHFCCWEFYKGRVNVFIRWWNICPAQGPPRPPPLPPVQAKISRQHLKSCLCLKGSDKVRQESRGCDQDQSQFPRRSTVSWTGTLLSSLSVCRHKNTLKSPRYVYAFSFLH